MRRGMSNNLTGMAALASRCYSVAALLLGFYFLNAFAVGSEPDDSIRASGKEAALAAFEVREGFRIELVAAEPLVMDPVAIDWGADGRLWVAEMADYPLGIDGKGKPGGRVRFLEDTAGDGRYDR